jgi:hypothetical protein
MKKLAFGIALLAILSSKMVYGQAASPAAAATAAKRTEVYSVTFIHAAPGKINALEDWAKKSGASAPMPGHSLVLRHESGSPWDYVAVEHVGTKATVEAAGNPMGGALRPLMDQHDDTFVNGPSWAAFAKEMDLDENGKGKSSDSVYRPMSGQEDALEKFLSEPPPAGDLTAGNVVLQHLEGGAWRFLSIARYKNYQDYATSEAKAMKETATGKSSWFQLRDLVSFHNDTIALRVGP